MATLCDLLAAAISAVLLEGMFLFGVGLESVMFLTQRFSTRAVSLLGGYPEMSGGETLLASVRQDQRCYSISHSAQISLRN